jgi:hypothetical protein
MSIKPDWNEIAQRIGDDLSLQDLHSEWSKECKKWLESIASEFGNDYRIEESPNFSIMSNEGDRYIHVFSGFLERTLKRILKTLDGIASDEGFGKHVALIFQDIERVFKTLCHSQQPHRLMYSSRGCSKLCVTASSLTG